METAVIFLLKLSYYSTVDSDSHWPNCGNCFLFLLSTLPLSAATICPAKPRNYVHLAAIPGHHPHFHSKPTYWSFKLRHWVLQFILVCFSGWNTELQAVSNFFLQLLFLWKKSVFSRKSYSLGCKLLNWYRLALEWLYKKVDTLISNKREKTPTPIFFYFEGMISTRHFANLLSCESIHLKIHNALILIIFKKIYILMLFENTNHTSEVKCYSFHTFLLFFQCPCTVGFCFTYLVALSMPVFHCFSMLDKKHLIRPAESSIWKLSIGITWLKGIGWTQKPDP